MTLASAIPGAQQADLASSLAKKKVQQQPPDLKTFAPQPSHVGAAATKAGAAAPQPQPSAPAPSIRNGFAAPPGTGGFKAAPQAVSSPAQQAAPQAPPPGTGGMRPPGPGWVQTQGGGWVPPDHPQAQTPAAAPPTAAPGAPDPTVYAPPGSLPTPTTQAYAPTDFTGPSVQGFQAPTLNTQGLPTYQTSQFAQFQAPDQTAATASQNALLSQVLANPESLSPQVVNALKEQQKEAALAMQRQAQEQFGQSAAARGLAGVNPATERRLADATQSNILGAYRDVDIAAAQTNMADRLRALGASEGVLSGQMGRAGEGFRNTLMGQSAQAGENQFGWQAGAQGAQFDRDRELSQAQLDQAAAADRFKSAGFDFDRERASADDRFRAFQGGMEQDQFGLARALAFENLRMGGADSAFRRLQSDRDFAMGNRSLDLQGELGRGGLDLDRSRLSEGGRQFDLSHALALQQFLENQRQFGIGAGLDYTRLGMQGQRDTIGNLF